MSIILIKRALFALLAVVALAGAGSGEIEVAASDQCHQQCQAVESRCRMATKDLNSSACNKQYLDCIARCRAK